MIRRQRRAIVAGLVLAGWAFGQAALGVPQTSATGVPLAATPTAAGAANAATPTVVGAATLATPAAATTTAAPAARGGSDAPWLRFGLIVMLGLALGSGAVVQYRATADAPPYEPKPRQPRRTMPRRRAAPRPAPGAAERVATPATAAATPIAESPVTTHAAERAPVFSAFPRQGQPSVMPAPPLQPQQLRVVDSAPRLTRAEGYCADAIAAAYRYDRPGTLAAFGEALDADPALKPSLLSDFWEMPAGGHADLAIAYLQREQRLDARSVVTMALLTFPHNRELSALLREIDPYRLDRPA